MSKIEFVEYTGRYPNLCSGRLFVKVDGKMISFGSYCLGAKGKTKDKGVPNYPAFWSSGGGIYYDIMIGMMMKLKKHLGNLM